MKRLRFSKYDGYFKLDFDLKEIEITFEEFKELYHKDSSKVKLYKGLKRSNKKITPLNSNYDNVFVFDFETTVSIDEDLEWCEDLNDFYLDDETKVWSAAYCPLNATKYEDVQVLGSIEDFYYVLDNLDFKAEFWAHNAGFDCSFLIYFFLVKLNKEFTFEKLKTNQFTFTMTDSGLFYKLSFLNQKGNIITFRDALKLCNMSLKKLGKELNTIHQKTEMEYKGKFSLSDCSDEDVEYIKNDCLVLAEALKALRAEGITQNTAASTALNEYKRLLAEEYDVFFKKLSKEEKQKEKEYKKAFINENNIKASEYPFRRNFPRQDLIKLDSYFTNLEIDKYLKKIEVKELKKIQYTTKSGENKEYTEKVISNPLYNLNMYLEKSYKGGFTWANPQFTNKIIKGIGRVMDATSLYPSQLHSKSGNIYPYGNPIFIEKINISPAEFYKKHNLSLKDTVYFTRCSFSFEIKKNKLPCIQIKNNPLFKSREWLTSSNGEEVLLYLTSVDLQLILENYNVSNLRFYDIVVYKAKKGLFDSFIDYWIKIKENSSPNGVKPNPTLRFIAKIQLNSLYGKFGSKAVQASKYPIIDYNYRRDSKGKIVKINGEKQLAGYKVAFKNTNLEYNDFNVVYMPVACFCTAYARRHTITLAQYFYSSDVNNSKLLYIDTDSIHYIDEKLENPNYRGIPTGKGLCTWKEEAVFKKSKYLRAKTYLEEIIIKDGKKLEEAELDLKCAGMPQLGKDKLLSKNYMELSLIKDGEEVDLYSDNLDVFELFTQGLTIRNGKLGKVIIKGGTRLVNMYYTIK